MKKNIIIAILVVLTTLSFVYALYQRTEAEKQMQLADKMQQQSMENALKAKQMEEMALRNQEEAIRQRTIAIECEGKKK